MTRINTMEDCVERVKGILDEMVRYTVEKEDLTKDFADVLHLIIPGERAPAAHPGRLAPLAGPRA